MKINLNASDQTLVEKLLNTKDINDTIGSIISEIVAYQTQDIARSNYSCAATASEYINLLKETYEIDDFLCGILKKGIKQYDVDEYKNNAYYKTIKIPNVKYKNWSLKKDHYLPFECFLADELTILNDEHYLEINKIGYFKEKFEFPAVIQENTIWMSITPHEINTMKRDIEKVKGNVVVFGLGLGYFPFMISLKDEVKSITIIERDKKVIELFKTYILPQFKNKEKIRIICADALKYIQNMPVYDYAYVDLWHDVFDAAPLYIPFKKKEIQYKNTKFLYWIEDSIITYFRRLLIVLLQEQLDNFKENNYQKEKDFQDKIINKFYYLTKELSIDSYKQINDLLSDQSILSLIDKLN